MNDLTLGLDLGTASVGWALVENNDENYEGKIIDSGVRIFLEGKENIGQGEKEKTKNAARREARGRRRQTYRKSRRLTKLINHFISNKLLGSNFNREKFDFISPYEARSKALDQEITLEELSRALYHIAKRRGYKDISNSTSDGSEKSVIFKGKDKPGINDLRNELEKQRYRTYGEYFWQLILTGQSEGLRVRDRYTERGDYISEFNQIWDKQAEYHHEILTDDLKTIFFDLIFYQRPLKSQKQNVGKCIFESQKNRIPRSNPLFQEFRLFQKINNLRIIGGSRIDSESQSLTSEERQALLSYLYNNKELKFGKTLKKLKEVLKLDKNIDYKLNYLEDRLQGMDTLVKIKKAIPDKYDDLDPDEVEQIYHTIYFHDDKEWFVKYVRGKWEFTEDEAINLEKMTLEASYGSLSKCAIEKILPFLQNGDEYSVACLNAGYHHSQKEEVEIRDTLPNPKHIANPIVMTGLHQLKKVVNDIIKIHGRPTTIKIELARELKQNVKQRQETFFNNKKREEEHKEIIEILYDKDIKIKPTRNDILKYKLWKEVGEVCPYSGKSIGLKELYSGNVHIEHIMPYSKTLDDSQANKTISISSENKFKGNRTPKQAYGSDPKKYNQILDRVKRFNHRKAQRFQETIEEFYKDEDFASRQLNDTAYISREATIYLRNICSDVQCVNGRSTSKLRNLWGLNYYLNEKDKNIKNRDDHRHHALDAIVVALTSRFMLHKLSRYNGYFESDGWREHEVDYIDEFPAPWDDFNTDVQKSISNIIISFKQNTKVRGRLHEETIYGRRRTPWLDYVKDDKGQSVYYIRKQLDSLTSNELKHIVDKKIKEIIFNRLIEHGVDTSEKKMKVPKGVFKEPLYLESKDGETKKLIKKSRVAKPFNGAVEIRKDAHVETGNNHHIILYKDIESGKTKGKTVSLFEATRRIKKGLPVIDKVLDNNSEFVMSIIMNEMFLVGSVPDGFDPNDKSTYNLVVDLIYRVQKIDRKSEITFRNQRVAVLSSKDKNGKELNPGRLIKVPNTLDARKIEINPSGYIKLAD